MEIAGKGPTRTTLWCSKDPGQRVFEFSFAAFHNGTVFARLDRWCDRKCHSNLRNRAYQDDLPGEAPRAISRERLPCAEHRHATRDMRHELLRREQRDEMLEILVEARGPSRPP